MEATQIRTYNGECAKMRGLKYIICEALECGANS